MTASASDPLRFTGEVFSWYIQALEAVPNPMTDVEYRETLRRALTPALFEAWPTLCERDNRDPLLCAQDYFPDWRQKMRASTLRAGDGRMLVALELGPPPKSGHRLHVDLVAAAEGWRIDGVERDRR